MTKQNFPINMLSYRLFKIKQLAFINRNTISQYEYQNFVMTHKQSKVQLDIQSGWINSAPHHLKKNKSDFSIKFLLSDAEECHKISYLNIYF